GWAPASARRNLARRSQPGLGFLAPPVRRVPQHSSTVGPRGLRNGLRGPCSLDALERGGQDTSVLREVVYLPSTVALPSSEFSALVKHPSEEDYDLKLRLHPMIPEQSTFKGLSTKTEIKKKKNLETVRWEKRDGHISSPAHVPKHNSSQQIRKDERLDRDADLNKLFQHICTEVKHAMNKSYMQSGGTKNPVPNATQTMLTKK
ncbi:Protein SGT1, partial [Galemys pyrenaicus]